MLVFKIFSEKYRRRNGIQCETYSIKMMYVLLCNHHSKDWLRLKSPRMLIPGEGLSEERVFTWPYCPHSLIVKKSQ